VPAGKQRARRCGGARIAQPDRLVREIARVAGADRIGIAGIRGVGAQRQSRREQRASRGAGERELASRGSGLALP